MGTLRQQTKPARAELLASEVDRKALMTLVVGDVATGYFSLLELDSELDIDKRTLATRENSLQLIKSRQQGGLATMLDVRQAEELVYQASQTIPDTERAIEQTENQISLLPVITPIDHMRRIFNSATGVTACRLVYRQLCWSDVRYSRRE